MNQQPKARNVTPRQAIRDGILDELQAPERLLERTEEVARDLAQIPRDAYRLGKRQLRAAAIRALDEIVQTGRDPMLEPWLTPEAATSSAKLLGSRTGRSGT